MPFPTETNTLASVSGSQSLAAGGHAARHNELKAAIESIRDILGGASLTPGTGIQVTSAGNVGIGTSSPGGKLQVGNGSDNASILQVGTANFVGITTRNVQSTASNNSTSYFDAQNQNSIADGHLFFVHEVDGSSTFIVGTTPAGSKSSDRRAERFRITGSGNVGIGTSSPGVALHVVKTAAQAALYLESATNYSAIGLRRAETSTTSPTIVTNGAALGDIDFWGYDGSTYQVAARIRALVDGAPGAGDMPGRISFWTAADGGTTLSERMNINNAGLITGTGTSLGAWTAYTPTLGGTGWAIGNGTTVARYCQIGKIVHVQVGITMGSTSTFGASAAMRVTMPTNIASNSRTIFSAIYTDASASKIYAGSGAPISTTEFEFYSVVSGTAGEITSVISTTPFTWTTSDVVRFSITYEST